MNDELKKLIERFEIEIWLYLDGSLNQNERKFWDKKIEQHVELRNIYEETIQTLDKYDELAEQSISDAEFASIISNLPKQESARGFFESVTHSIDSFFSNQFVGFKIAAVSVLSVTALILLLTTEKPNAVKQISSDILSWQGTVLNEDINKMDNSIETLSMEEWEKFQYIQATHDEWEKSYYILNSKIEKMKNDIGDTSL